MSAVHVAYGGAHLVQQGTASKWRQLALRAFETYVPSADVLVHRFDIPAAHAEGVHARVDQTLRHPGALQALRIDFEDGYGVRANDEEDRDAEAAARAVAAMHEAPRSLGIRAKSLALPTRARALRTLSRFFEVLGAPPREFVVTLPKVQGARDVAMAVGALAALESRFGFEPLGIELMAETPELFAELQKEGLRHVRDAAEGRLRSLHFGAYDMLSALGVPGHEQRLSHPYATPLRLQLAAAAMPLDLPLYDGATLAMPVPTHRGAEPTRAQTEANGEAVLGAMRAHFDNVQDALALGWAGSWDLHPAQLVPRHLATVWSYQRALPIATPRLGAFLANAARATRAEQSFDDAASARGLLRFFVQGLEAGALLPADLTGLPVPADALRSLTFEQLVARVAQPSAAEVQLPR